MLSFIARRTGAMLFVLLGVITITFLLIRLAPGGPFDSERKLPPAIEKALLQKYKLEGPLWKQYTDYLRDLLRGDLRLSTKYRNRSVNEILGQTLPITFTLGGIAFLLAATGGLWIGSFAAVHHGSKADTIAMFGALLAISLPAFIIGPLLILVFALWLGWLPVGGWEGISKLILPAITLATPYTAYVARLTRGSMLEALNQDFIRTARSKGVSERTIVYRQALRVAILPVITFLGPLAANLLTGSIVVESIFNIPGAGNFFVNSILNRDGFLLSGVVIVYCALLVLINLLVDITHSILDPRITLEK